MTSVRCTFKRLLELLGAASAVCDVFVPDMSARVSAPMNISYLCHKVSREYRHFCQSTYVGCCQ
jgi:hypothetical protein